MFFRRVLPLIFLAVLMLAGTTLAADVSLDQKIDQINRANAAANAHWRAGHSFVAEMPLDEFKAMLGVDFSAYPQKIEPWVPERYVTPPAHFDWRDVEGDNYVTPVKYQGRCGSCVAFGVVGMVESAIRIREQNPNLNVDLSEQQAFDCTLMAGCDMGSTAGAVLSTFKQKGVVDEDCFPYMSGGTGYDYPCQDACDDAASRKFKIAGFNTIWGGVSQIKQAIMLGPVTASFTVYEDLKYYIDGVYDHTFGEYLGGHQIVLIGWDDADQCWIAKNSWSESFGEDGFFRIKWDTCGISSDVTKVNVGTAPYTPGDLPGGDCAAAAAHLYDTCSLSYELNDQCLTASEFLNYCESGNMPQCVFSCDLEHDQCNRLSGCIGFCTDQWCAMDFTYLYDTCGLAVTLDGADPMSKEDATAVCEEVGYASNTMKCILECIPQTNTCTQLDNCMQDCPLCPFPTVDFVADVTSGDAPLTVTFTRSVTIPADCDPTVTHWDFGDDAATYEESDVVTHTYTTGGIYSVELRVTNAAGPGIKLAEDMITVTPLPPPDDDTIDDDTIDDDTTPVDDDTVDDDTTPADDDTVDDDTTPADDDTVTDDDTTPADDDTTVDDDTTPADDDTLADDDTGLDDDLTNDDAADDDTVDDDTLIDDSGDDDSGDDDSGGCGGC